ncbi:PIG-L family deacetylase, partial [Patescibacteria group bacterium]|nr:PIG-L family deacetylase [Patescibacteria group bacterium]
DNAFDSIPLLDIVKTIEEIKKETRPYMIFTHSDTDLNIDHQLTHKAVLTATRPQPQETVTEIYAFEVLSSTEWNFPVTFSPDTFIDITQTLPKKLDAMAAYASELRDYPHPRSLEGIRTQAKHRGLQVALSAAEAFKTIRKVQ